MIATKLITIEGRALHESGHDEQEALLGEAALNAVLVALNRWPCRSMFLIIEGSRVFLSVDEERITAVDGFAREFVVRVLKACGLRRLIGTGVDVQVHVNVNV